MGLKEDAGRGSEMRRQHHGEGPCVYARECSVCRTLCSDSVYLCLLVIHNAFIQLVMREISHGSNIA